MSNYHLHRCSFDTENRVWQTLQAMPFIWRCLLQNRLGAVEFDDKVYVANGNSFICYDPTRGIWSVKANIPSPTPGTPSLATLKNFIYAIESDWTLHRYDASQSTWITVNIHIRFTFKRC